MEDKYLHNVTKGRGGGEEGGRRRRIACFSLSKGVIVAATKNPLPDKVFRRLNEGAFKSFFKTKGKKLMTCYETVFIARQDISAKQAEDLAKKFSDIVNDNGAKVVRTEHWGLRNLAYRIKKNRKGHYVMLHIEGPHTAVAEMERNIRLNEDILRYMTVRLEKTPEGPSIMMRAKEWEGDENKPEFVEGDVA